MEEVFDHLKCTKDGLSSDEVKERLNLFGYNKLEEKKESKLLKFLGFMWNPLSWFMEAAAILAIVFSQGGANLHYNPCSSFFSLSFPSLPVEYKVLKTRRQCCCCSYGSVGPKSEGHSLQTLLLDKLVQCRFYVTENGQKKMRLDWFLET